MSLAHMVLAHHLLPPYDQHPNFPVVTFNTKGQSYLVELHQEPLKELILIKAVASPGHQDKEKSKEEAKMEEAPVKGIRSICHESPLLALFFPLFCSSSRDTQSHSARKTHKNTS
jgi:hypothetical protein